jgi:hypothetical protein
MKTKQRKTGRGGLGALFLPVLLLACGLAVGGCESDAVAPQDELPEITEADAVQQAALVAVGVATVGPEILRFQVPKPRDKDLGVYIYEFPVGGDISGKVILEYFADGLPSLKKDADYGKLYTPKGKLVVIELEMPGGAKPVFELGFALEGDIDQDADTATVSGGGTLTSGERSGDFSFTDLILTQLSSYPNGGILEFSAGLFDLVVKYDGDDTANVYVDDVIKYEIDLDTGIVTLIEE